MVHIALRWSAGLTIALAIRSLDPLERVTCGKNYSDRDNGVHTKYETVMSRASERMKLRGNRKSVLGIRSTP